MAAKRSYRQYCVLAHALDVIGERWTLLIVRDLLLGPKRYSDLLEGLPGISTNLLADRLKALEHTGLVRRRTLPPPAASTVYELTQAGRELQPSLATLLRWSTKWLGAPAEAEVFRAEWAVLALREMVEPQRTSGVSETYEFRTGDETFHLRRDLDRVEVHLGPAVQPDLVVVTDPQTLLGMGTGQLDHRQALTTGRMRVEGDPAALARCIEILDLPSPDDQEKSEI